MTASDQLPDDRYRDVSQAGIICQHTGRSTVQQGGRATFGDRDGIGIGDRCLVADRGNGDADRGIRGLAVIVGYPVGK